MPYDPYKLTDLDALLEKGPQVTTDLLPSQIEGFFPTLFETAGQTLWGGVTGFTWGVPEIADIAEEAVTGRSNRIEEIVTGLPAKILTLGHDDESYAGDFSPSATDRELTTPGKIGYSVGNALGMIASFGWLGKGVGWGVKGISKIGSGGITTATKLAQDDIAESFGRVVFKAGQKEGAQELTEEVSKELATSTLDTVSKSGVLYQAHKELGDAAFHQAAKLSIKEEVLKPLLGTIDDALLDDFASEAFEIALRRSPNEGMHIIYNGALNLAKKAIKDPKRARIVGGIVGASTYDAILGTVIGSVRGLAEYKINEYYDWNKPESLLGHILDTAAHEAAIFSILGPIKFIRGGSRLSAWKKTKDMTRGVTNRLKNVKKMKPEELETTMELYHHLSGGNIAAHLGGKWVGKADGWWRGVSKLDEKAAARSVKEIREFLTASRKEWLKEAPGVFFRELGADMFYSLPRMMTGAVAMNLTGLKQAIDLYGVEGFMKGFGETDYEKFSNILTAMYFTRTPHSFHLPGAPIPKGIFETGNIKNFGSSKGEQFSKVVTGLNLIGGKNFKSALRIANQYGGMSDTTPENHGNKIFSKSFEGSNEVQNIKEIIDPHSIEKYVTPRGDEPVGSLREASARHISEDIVDPAEKARWRDKRSTALAIVRWHNQNSIRTLDISPGLTKEAAANLVDKLSSIEFGGVRLNAKEPIQQMDDWLATRIQKESNVPIDIIKDFVVEMYRELGVPNVAIDGNGNILVPRLNQTLFSSYIDANTNKGDGSRSHASEALTSLVTATEKLKAAGGIIKFSDTVHETATNESITEAVRIKDTAVNRMMQYVHGDAWETKAIDDSILRQDVWYTVHNRMSDAAQKLNIERVLKGSGDSSLDENSANQLYKGLRDEISGERFPDITDKDVVLTDVDISANADLATAVKDMKRVYRLLSLVNPQSNAGASRSISPGRLIELHSQWSRMLGDVVTNNKMYELTQEYLIGKSIKTLGISSLSGGYNMHAAVHELVTNREFMRETGMQIPSLKQIVDLLGAKFPNRESNKVELETYEKVKGFYENVVSTIQNARFGSIQIRDMVEQQPGAWYEAIRSSMMTGRGRASQFAVERIVGVMNKAQGFLDQQGIYGMELVASASQRATNTVEEKRLVDLFKASDGDIKQAISQLKRALDSGDGLIVHAFESRMDKISELLDLALEASVSGTHGQYTQGILKHMQDALSKAHRDGWTELNVVQEAHMQMERYTVPEKDKTGEGLRVSSSQFAQRYNLNITDMTDMFLSYRSMNTTMDNTAEAILRVLNKVDPTFEYNGLNLYTPEQVREITKTKEYVKSVIAKSGAPDPNNFWKDIVEPLIIGIRMNEMVRHRSKVNKTPDGGWNKFNQTLLSDISSITTAYFSSMPIKQYSYRNGGLFLSDKKVGYTEKHGVQGIISALNSTSEVSLLSNSFYIDGKYVSKPSKLEMERIIKELESGEGISVEMDGGLREYMADKNKIDEHRKAQGNDTIDLNKQRFKVIAADESTLILVRMGRDNRIQQDLLSAFRQADKDVDGKRIPGGHLYEKLSASLDYNQSSKSVEYPPLIRELVDKINEGKLDVDGRDNNIHDAIVLTRLINDRPSLIRKWADMPAPERKKVWKYLKLSEMKNGFVGHEENLARVRSFLEGASESDKSGFFKNVLEQARIFLPKDKKAEFPKLKLLHVADEMVHGGDKINIFSSIDHKKAELSELRDTGIISKRTYDENIESYKSLTKSIVDGETFLSKRAFAAHLAMMGGISPDMIKFNPDGSIKEILIGGIKPTISHTDIKTDMNDLTSYGRVKEFYAKTAFKYNPEFDVLFKSLGVDGITFNSSNKVNEFRNNLKDPWYNTDLEQMESTLAAGGRNVHASIKPIEKFSDIPRDFGSVSEWLGKNLIYDKTNISEIPFESINLKSLGQPHDPLVGSNISVHMHDNVGIVEWIKLQDKLNNVYGAFEKYVDPYYATRLAKDLFAHSSETGDMTWLNTGIDHFLKHDGLLTAPWQKTRIEEKIIPYFMNNGSIAAGRVPEGSLDVMTADTGGLRTSVIRTEGDGSKSVQLYGEFLQSKHSAGKEFKIGGIIDRADVQSIIMQRTDHAGFDIEGNYQIRKSDAFMIRRGKKKYIVVEGKGIDENGDLRDIYNDKQILYQGKESDNKKARAYNRNLFKQLDKRENDFLNLVEKGDTYSEAMTKLYHWNENIDGSMAIGSLNNRQPRNQSGDIVIARLKSFEKDGKLVTHNGDLSGNSSRMNHADAINPQDADYDMDKSSSFLAAPSRLWAEAARLSGYRTVDDVKSLEHIFNVEYNKIFSPHHPELFTFEEGADPQRYKAEINATDLARGRFVKMHQTLTYLHNIFRENPAMIIMKNPWDPHRNVEVRMSPEKLKYFNTIDEVSRSVKLFLDMYKDNPIKYTENPESLIKELIFGFERSGIKHEGLFELFDSKTQQRINRTINDSDMNRAKNDIYYGLLGPIGRYLRYNKGTTVDENNRDLSATLQDYQNAYDGLIYSILPSKKGLNYRLEKAPSDAVIYSNKAMYESANNFFAKSLNPFDFAMKGLNSVSNKHYRFEEINSSSQYIINYLREGRVPDNWELPTDIPESLRNDFQLNRIAKEAMIQLSKKSGDIIRLESMVADLRRINSKLEYLDSIGGGKSDRIQESTQYRKLLGEKIRIEELKSIIEEHLSYDPGNPENDYAYNPAKKIPVSMGDYTNMESKPLVLANKNGETKEVILPGRRNIKKIFPSDRLVINGNRYEVVEGEVQMGLRADFKAFGGETRYVNKDGSVTYIEAGERVFIDIEYGKLKTEINEAYAKMPFRTQADLGEYAAKRTALILDKLASPDFIGQPERQLALLFKMLTPGFDNRVSPIIPVRFGSNSRESIIGSVKYIENKLSKTVYNTLAQVANGSVETVKGGIDKIMANELLKDFVALSRNYYVQERTGIEVDMNKLEKVGFTEPTELPNGYMTDTQYLDKRIFALLRDGNTHQRQAAGIMYDYLSGKKLVDSATLYKASKEMERQGIPLNDQFMMKVYDRTTNTFGDVEVRDFGIIDAYKSRNRGQGGVVKESTSRQIQELFKCLTIN